MVDQSQNKKGIEKLDDEIRYRYIGFDVYPKKSKEFWKGEGEKKNYLEEIKKRGFGSALAQSGHSLIRAVVFTKVDRLVLTVTSLLLTISFFLPWFSIRGEFFSAQVLGLGFFLKVGTLLGYAPLSGTLFSVFLIIVGLTIASSFIAGLLTLLALYKKHTNPEVHLTNLKKKLKLNLIPLALWGALIVISSMGFSTPFADAFRIEALGDSFTVVNFFMLSSFGIWLSLPSVIINCIKIGDL
jgi:hypothetical protein